jgi:hypothetical protein
MKRLLLDRRGFLSSSAAVLLAGWPAGQLNIPGMGGGEAGSAGSGGLGQESDAFEKYVASGTKNMLLGLSDAGWATGQKEEAAHYAAAADSIKSESISRDDFTKKNALITKSSFRPEDLAKAQSEEAKEYVKRSFTHFTIGSFSDQKAGTSAQALVTVRPSPADLTNGTVTNAITVAKTATDAVPEQLTTAAKWLSALRAYMKAHGMKVPTAAEAKKVAMEQGMQPGLLKDFPTTT